MANNNYILSSHLRCSFTQVLVFTSLLLSLCTCNIWDNIFSQTQSSYPIILSQSFNFDFKLPQQYGLDGNIDFNSQLKFLTISISKDIFIQKLDIVKAQLDLNTLVLNVNQFLLGCQRYKLGIDQTINQQVSSGISSVTVSKKSLFLVNLLFKYVGVYQFNNGGLGNKSPQNQDQGNILEDLKNAFFGGDKKINEKSGNKRQSYNMYEFSIDFYKNPNQILDKAEEGKQAAQKFINNDQLNDQLDDFDLAEFDFDELKFVLITDSKSGQIQKVFRNKQMKQELEFDLSSKQKKAIQCKGQVKILTMNDLKDGAKYLYQNKQSWEDVFKF